ncbi:MAG: Rpn family recombination-promoting nuclease/putative transposase [Planctomycetota bacterium]|nr:Rpn family recombination-promoting nuclease/putative transposase [Planctomycetota bacterium]
MIPGIDPKIDIAFKKVFGSEPWRDLTASLINAVLEPPPQQRLVDVELLNPYSEKMTLDDKLSILDIKARDDEGRLYNLEMQMLATASLVQRLLYYWSKIYSQQLAEGDDYTRLRPTISICFVNGVLFTDGAEHHTRFRLLDATGQLCLTDDLVVHVIELPKFTRTLAELRTPLDFWLYFFKNGAELDADALPEPMDKPDQRKAMGVLKMLAQSDVERELYEGRLKAKRDLQTLETMRHTLETQRDQWQRQAIESQQRIDAVTRERDEARKLAFVREIQLCQRLLKLAISGTDELLVRSAEELQEQAERLERALTGVGPA